MPNAEVSVTIGSITMNDSLSFTNQLGYFLEDTPTLLNPPPIRLTMSDKQSAHGINDSLAFYKERPLHFKGHIIGSSQADRKTKENALKQTLGLPAQQNFGTNDGYVLVLITDEDGVAKQCYAKILDGPTISIWDNDAPAIRAFAFLMMAKDKNLYSQTLQTQSGTETVAGSNFSIVSGVSPTIPFTLYGNIVATCTCVSAGTTGSPPVLTIAGPTQSPIVTNTLTGKLMSFPGLILLSGETLVIDVNAVSMTKTDVSAVKTDVSGYYDSVNSQFIFIEPGSNPLDLTDASPNVIAATLTCQWRDAYL